MAGLWRYSYEQENLPTEQPQARQGARFPSAYAHSCRSRDPRRAPPQGPHRALRVVTPPVEAVLSKPNRVVRAEDFRATIRRGKRVSTEHAVLYFAERESQQPARFGFVIAKSVGGAVTRNLMRRRLRAIGHELVASGVAGRDVVVRPLPGSDRLPWTTLHQEIYGAIERGTRG